MRISDWSSDVCSSDLGFLQLPAPQHTCSATRLSRNTQGKHNVPIRVQAALPRHRTRAGRRAAGVAASRAAGDRKSVVSGKRVSVRVDTGGRRIIKKKKKK